MKKYEEPQEEYFEEGEEGLAEAPVRKSIEEIYLNRAEIDYPKPKSFLQRLLVFILWLVIIGGLVGLGAWIYLKVVKKPVVQEKPSIVDATASLKSDEAQKSASEDNMETVSDEDATPRETAQAPADIKISVLNGGSSVGAAGKLQTTLRTLGYTKAEAGNAQGSVYSGTVVYYSDDFKAAAEQLAEKIKDKYAGVSVKPATSVEEKAASIVIILGK